jgi:hypothetical protein
MSNPKLSPRAVVAALGVVFAVTTAAEWRAVGATDPQPHTITRAECTSCHSGPAAMRMLRDKEGGGFLFTDKAGPWARDAKVSDAALRALAARCPAQAPKPKW